MNLGLTQPTTEMGDKDSWCIGLTKLPPSCANCLEIWEPQPPRMLRTFPRPVMGLPYLLPL
jgi:hypothetical protein